MSLPLEFADTFTDIVGSHQLKFGFDVKKTRDFISNLRSEYGSYQYNSVADFVTDYTNAINGNVGATKRYGTYQQGIGLRDYALRTPDYA